MELKTKSQFLLSYHLPLFPHTYSKSLLCLMYQQHFHKAQRKAEAALLASMQQWQQRLEMTQPGLPSSDVLWCSLRLQLLVELQRLAWMRKLTLLEAKEVILRTKAQDLSMQEWCWLEQAHNLVSIMPPPMRNKVKHYDLSSYPPMLIPHPEVMPVPSTLTVIRRPLMLTSSTTDPPSMLTMPCPSPAGALTLTTPTPCLPHLANLIRTIFQMDPSPMPSSGLPYQATRCPLSVTPMAAPRTTARFGVDGKPRPPLPTMPHQRTCQTLYQSGS